MNEDLRVVLEALADHWPEHSDYSGYYFCQFCSAERTDEPAYNLTPEELRDWLTHKPGCAVLKARKLLLELQ